MATNVLTSLVKEFIIELQEKGNTLDKIEEAFEDAMDEINGWPMDYTRPKNTSGED